MLVLAFMRPLTKSIELRSFISGRSVKLFMNDAQLIRGGQPFTFAAEPTVDMDQDACASFIVDDKPILELRKNLENSSTQTILVQDGMSSFTELPLLDLFIQTIKKLSGEPLARDQTFKIECAGSLVVSNLYMTKLLEISPSSSNLVSKRADYCSFNGEMAEWVSSDCVPLAVLPRHLIHQFNLLHRGT